MHTQDHARGERLALLRTGAGFPEKTAAVALGIPLEEYREAEQGLRGLSDRERKLLAVLFGCDPEELL